MFSTCSYAYCMSRMIQVRNVPDELHAALKARAALAGQSLSEYLLGQLRRVSQHPTPEELRQRLATRRPVRPRVPPARVVRAERRRR
jgi:plasmid stability protein